MPDIDITTMWPDTAATLAQVLPVLMLTLLFENKLRPEPPEELTPLAVAIGFVSNFAIAVAAVLVEISLLLIVNQQTRVGARNGFGW